MSVIDVDGGDSRNPDELAPDIKEPEQENPPQESAITYTYDPSQVMDGGLNQMRFELGDTELEPHFCTAGDKPDPHSEYAAAVMSDQSYIAIIENSASWKEAKIRCLRHLLMLFMYQVDYSIDGLSEKLSDRYNKLKKMLDGLLRGDDLPKAGGLNKWGKGPHIFHYGMFENPRKW